MTAILLLTLITGQQIPLEMSFEGCKQAAGKPPTGMFPHKSKAEVAA